MAHTWISTPAADDEQIRAGPADAVLPLDAAERGWHTDCQRSPAIPLGKRSLLGKAVLP